MIDDEDEPSLRGEKQKVQNQRIKVATTRAVFTDQIAQLQEQIKQLQTSLNGKQVGFANGEKLQKRVTPKENDAGYLSQSLGEEEEEQTGTVANR